MDYIALQHTATVISVLTLTSPLELIKTRLQTDRQLISTGKIQEKYRSVRHCLATIAKNQGMRSLWKGNAISITRFFPNQSINYHARAALQNKIQGGFYSNVMAAVLAGWAASTLLYPLDTLRLALTSQTQKGVSSFNTLRKVFQKSGPKFLYQGYLNSLIGIAIFRGSFNGLYDSAKSNANSIESKALIAYLSAVVAGIISYPLDSIRKQKLLLNSRQNLVSYGRKVWSQDGLAGFYRGSNLIFVQALAGALILLLFDTSTQTQRL